MPPETNAHEDEKLIEKISNEETEVTVNQDDLQGDLGEEENIMTTQQEQLEDCTQRIREIQEFRKNLI